ncbi:hypothetical protein BKA81DRAFT_366473, partial [Phyllosticta paracitricarpa]
MGWLVDWLVQWLVNWSTDEGAGWMLSTVPGRDGMGEERRACSYVPGRHARGESNHAIDWRRNSRICLISFN